MFVTESPALDFLNSVAVPLDTEVEWLGSGDDLLAWLEQAGLVQSDVLEDFRKTAGPGALDAVAAQARALREWFRGFVQKHKGRRVTRSAINQLEPLNRVLARDEVYGQIVPGPSRRAPMARFLTSSGRRCGAGARPTPCCCRSPRRWPTSLPRQTSPT